MSAPTALGLGSATGAGSSFTIAGRSFRLAPFTLSFFGEVENHLKSLRPNLLRQVAEQVRGLPPGEAQRFIDAAVSRLERAPVITPDEVQAFLNSREGIAYTMWLLIERATPGAISQEDFRALIVEASELDIRCAMESRDIAAGYDAVPKTLGEAASL